MGDDGVIFCNNDHPNIGMSWNWQGNGGPGSTIIDNAKDLLINTYYRYVDHWLVCEFTLRKETRIIIPTQRRNSRRVEYLHLDQPYYLQMANGGISNGKLEYHGFNNKITTLDEIHIPGIVASGFISLH